MTPGDASTERQEGVALVDIYLAAASDHYFDCRGGRTAVRGYVWALVEEVAKQERNHEVSMAG